MATQTTTLPPRWSANSSTVCTAASHGVANTTTSASAATVLPAPSMARSCSGHAARISPTTDSARSGWRDPMVTGVPAAASRRARPRPSGPVPPRIPTCTLTPLHTAPGDQPLRRAPRVWSVAVGLLEGKRILITGVLTDASLAFAVARLAQDEGADIVLSRRRPGPVAHQTRGTQASPATSTSSRSTSPSPISSRRRRPI